MSLIVLYLSSFLIFLVLDYFGLSYIVKPVFEREIGPMMRSSFLVLPAFVFYAFFMAAVLWFVSWPAISQDKTILWVFGNALILGAMAYGTYEFSNLATLKGWTAQMVAVDLIWGACLTGVSASLGVMITRAIT